MIPRHPRGVIARPAAALVVVGGFCTPAIAVDYTRVVAEADIVFTPNFAQFASFSPVGTNASGGYAVRGHTGSSFGDNYGMNPAIAETLLIGSATPVSSAPFFNTFKVEDAARLQNMNPADDPPGLAIGTRTYFTTQFSNIDLDDAGNLAYRADVIYNDTAGPSITEFRDRVDSIWFNDTVIAVEGDAVADPMLSGFSYTSASLLGMGESGGLVYRSSYSDGLTEGSGLFGQDGNAFFRSGDAIGNTSTTVADAAFAFGNSAMSLDGQHNVSATDGADGVEYLVLDGNAVSFLVSGQTYVPGALIGLENGARTATEVAPTSYNTPSVGSDGNWAFVGFSDDDLGDPDGDFDSVAIINGYITFRELDEINDESGTPVTIDNSAGKVAFNSDGDILVMWDNAVILNGTVIAVEGTDIINDADDFGDFQSSGTLSDRDASGNVTLYFSGRNDGANSNDTIYTATTAFDTGAVLGDMDISGTVDLDDVLAFVTALESRYAYTGLYGSAVDARGDINGDGLFNLSDVEPFAALVGVPAATLFAAVPEPGALAAVLGLLPVLYGRRRRADGTN